MKVADKYIRALQFAEEKQNFTLQELVVELCLSDSEVKMFIQQIYAKQMFYQDANNYLHDLGNLAYPLQFSVDDKFKLLNYEALQDARESSRSATRFAISALLVSIVASGIGIYFTRVQINSDVNLPKQFTEQIEKISGQQVEANKQLMRIVELLAEPRADKRTTR